MRALRVAAAVVAVAVGLAAVAPASAHGYYRGGARGYWYGPSVGFYYGGGPYGWGASGYYGAGYGYPYGYGSPYGYGYVPPAYMYGPPGVVTSTAGVVYIERDQQVTSTQQAAPAAPRAPGSQWWYLCDSPRGAYPHVRECPGGWERVPAVPPGPVR